MERGLFVIEMKSGNEISHALRTGEVMNEDIENVFEDNAKKDERTRPESEILDVRQKIYAKLNAGQDVFPLVKKFKKKVEN